MTALEQALGDYLRLRRGLGYALERDQPLLEQFVAFLDQAGTQQITTELALQWARFPNTEHAIVWRKRLSMVRQFARYLATIDPLTEIPPSDLLPAHRPRIAPYIYAPQEIKALIVAARALPQPATAALSATAIGVLASTGLRLREALALDRADVDLDDGVLNIRPCKNHRQRLVPLHPSVTAALSRYSRVRDEQCPSVDTPALFTNSRGGRPTKSGFAKLFHVVIAQAGLEGRGERVRPRPHDLRHTFAVRTLINWHRQGEDIDRKMPTLSTYLGHVSPESTYWYLQSVPELQFLVTEWLEQAGQVLT